VLAKKFRTDHALALALWDAGNVDAQFLATLLIEPKKLSAKAMGLWQHPIRWDYRYAALGCFNICLRS
jgi:hypothetical protein